MTTKAPERVIRQRELLQKITGGLSGTERARIATRAYMESVNDAWKIRLAEFQEAIKKLDPDSVLLLFIVESARHAIDVSQDGMLHPEEVLADLTGLPPQYVVENLTKLANGPGTPNK